MDPTDSPSVPASQPSRRRWLVTGIALAAALSAITGVISYSHGLDVARLTGNTGVVSYLVPLVPDLMIAMSSLVLFVASLIRADRPRTAMAALVAGIGWTVAQNVAAGWHQGQGGRALDAGIPLAFVLTFESLLWLFRRFRKGDPSATAGEAAPLTTEEALQALLDSDTERKLAMLLRVDRNRIQDWKSQLEKLAEPVPAAPPLVAAMNGSAP